MIRKGFQTNDSKSLVKKERHRRSAQGHTCACALQDAKGQMFLLYSIFDPSEGGIKITEELREYEVPLFNDLYSAGGVEKSAAKSFLSPSPWIPFFTSITCCDNSSSLRGTKSADKSPRPASEATVPFKTTAVPQAPSGIRGLGEGVGSGGYTAPRHRRQRPWTQAGPSASPPFVLCCETGAQVSGDPGRPAQFSAGDSPQSE